MAGANIPITFKIFKGDQLVREETLTQPVIKVGKLSSSHLRLDDDSVSRMHAVIEVTGPGDVSIIDLGSTKGTFVNGQKVNKAKLQSGDAVALGDTKLEISIGAEAAADEPDEDDAPTRVQASPAAPADSGVIASTPRPEAEAPAPPAAPPPPAAASAPRPPAPQPPPAAAPSAPTAPPPPVAPPPGMGAPASAAAPPPAFGLDSIDDMGGSRAIEVAAMLGDSVVGVKHVMNPRGGKITPLTYGLFAGAGVMLLMSAIAFFVSVDNAKFNQEAKEAFTAEQGNKAYEFRDKRLSLGYDFMAFGGLAIGLTCAAWGLVRYRNEREQPFFRIGQASDVEFATDAAPAATFPLVAPLGDDFVFNFAQGMQGEMTVDGQSAKLEELAGQGRARSSTTAPGAMEVPIPPKARIRVEVGKNSFIVSSVPQPRKQAVPLFASYSSTFMAFFAGSAIVHLGFWALLRTIPPDPWTMPGSGVGDDGRITRVQSKPDEDPKQEEEEELEQDSNDESGGTGTAMALDEGKMGKEESDRETGQYMMKKTQEQEQLAKQQQLEQARNAGILGVFKAQQGGAFASLTGTGDISSGFDDQNIFGGLLGDEAGEMQGGFGFGRSGFGPGGGGTGWGTIGTGRYGTIGHGSGTGSGYGTGSGRGGMRGRRAVTPQVRIGNATATGDLDKNIIRRYIRRKLPRIKYCYEKELLVKPGLGGTVVTQFTISPQGSVLNANASGVNGTVSSCVADVIKTIQFPAPKGGGLVQVRYPFTFRQQ